MSAVRFKAFQIGLMLATALSVSMLATEGRAYTPEQEQACSGDAMRLCSAYVPDVDRITACMVQNKSQLSPGCRVYFREPEAEPVTTRKPLSIKPVTAKPKKSGTPRKSTAS